MLTVLERSKVVSMIISVLQLWVVVMVLLPVVLTSVVWEVRGDGSSDTLLSSSCKLVVAVIVLPAVVVSSMNCVLVIWIRMSIVVMVEIMIHLRLRRMMFGVLGVGVVVMVAVVAQIVIL